MTLTMTFKTGEDIHMRGYNLNSSPAGKTWNINVPPDGSPVYDAGGAFLFPYNRKTVKIGGV